MAKVYIEKKAVTDWLAAKSREASKHAEAQTRFGDVDGGHCFSAESVAYLETETFINSLPMKAESPCRDCAMMLCGECTRPGGECERKIAEESDAQNAADAYIGHPYEIDEGFDVTMRRDAYKDGILYERERLMKEAVQGEVVHINGFPTLENVVLPSEFLRVQPGSKVKLIILK